MPVAISTAGHFDGGKSANHVALPYGSPTQPAEAGNETVKLLSQGTSTVSEGQRSHTARAGGQVIEGVGDDDPCAFACARHAETVVSAGPDDVVDVTVPVAAKRADDVRVVTASAEGIETSGGLAGTEESVIDEATTVGPAGMTEGIGERVRRKARGCTGDGKI